LFLVLLQFTNTITSSTNRGVGFTYLTMELGTSGEFLFGYLVSSFLLTANSRLHFPN
jgi:hypothetical protein